MARLKLEVKWGEAKNERIVTIRDLRQTTRGQSTTEVKNTVSGRPSRRTAGSAKSESVYAWTVASGEVRHEKILSRQLDRLAQ